MPQSTENKRAVPTLAIVVPCLDEEEVLPETCSALLAVLNRLIKSGEISQSSFIGFIDDGSKDNTWQVIQTLSQDEPRVRGIKLSANFGHQNALLAGLLEFKSQSDCIISIDADLQDDIDIIREMVQKFRSGCEIVYGVRRSREKDTLFKKLTAGLFYSISRLIGMKVIYNHADFRLAGRKSLDTLEQFQEVNLFLRGIFPAIGFRTGKVFYVRKSRQKGLSKFPFRRMVSFALDGITSFSSMPLRWITLTGFLIFTASIVMSFYAIYSYLFLGAVHGWASIVLPAYFLGGIQILCIGIIGEYLGKIYKETKLRPRFIIEEKLT